VKTPAVALLEASRAVRPGDGKGGIAHTFPSLWAMGADQARRWRSGIVGRGVRRRFARLRDAIAMWLVGYKMQGASEDQCDGGGVVLNSVAAAYEARIEAVWW